MHFSANFTTPALKFVMLVFFSNVFPHHEEDGGADQAVLDGAGEEEGRGVVQQLAHDVILPVALADHVAEVKQGVGPFFSEMLP